MQAIRWWQFGLVGGIALLLATAVKAVRVVVSGDISGAEGGEVISFAAVIFGMGFVCGIIAWVGRGLYERIGMVGDALVGVAVMLGFFVMCMLLFAPELLVSNFLGGGVWMLAFAAVIGLIAGPWFGRDLRK